MAWMPTQFLLRGFLDNRQAGRICGWLRFAGIPVLVLVDLAGDFEDIPRERIALAGPGQVDDPDARSAMAGFGLYQSGRAIRMFAGRSGATVARPRLEWLSEQDGPVVLDLEAWHLHVLGQMPPIVPLAARGGGFVSVRGPSRPRRPVADRRIG